MSVRSLNAISTVNNTNSALSFIGLDLLDNPMVITVLAGSIAKFSVLTLINEL